MRQWIERVVAWWRAIGRVQVIAPDPRLAAVERLVEALERERAEQRAMLEGLWKAHTQAMDTLGLRIVEAVQAANPNAFDTSPAAEIKTLPVAIQKAIDQRSAGSAALREQLTDYAFSALAENPDASDDVADTIRRGADLRYL